MAVKAGTDRPVQFGRPGGSQEYRRGPVIYSSGRVRKWPGRPLASRKGFQKTSGVAPLPDPAVDRSRGAAQWRGWPVSVPGSALGARRCPHERGIEDARAPRCPKPGRVAFPAVVLSGRHGAAGLATLPLREVSAWYGLAQTSMVTPAMRSGRRFRWLFTAARCSGFMPGVARRG